MEEILAIIGIFFVPAVLVILIVWFRNNVRNKRYQLQADLYAKALEKGQPVPADLFAAEPERKRSPLNTGIILMSAGLGISLLFVLMAISLANFEPDAFFGLMSAASVGVVPFLVGVGYLIIHYIEKKKASAEHAK